MRMPTNPTTTLLREVRDEIRRSFRGGRVIVAVDGRDGARTSELADGLAEAFDELDIAAFRASPDGFHRPRAERYARGLASADGFYRDSYDYETMRRVLIDPFRDGAQTSATTGFQLAAWDADRDAPVESRWVTAPADAVLVIDGLFLLRPELRGLWDFSVWLDVPVEQAFARLAERRGIPADPEAPANARVHGGQELYESEAWPVAVASIIIDNVDPARPRRVSGPAHPRRDAS